MASLRLQPAQPVNAHFFGYNLETYATSGVELAFNDTAGLALARALHLGALRYPGGTVSNIWDVRDGRFVQPPAPIGKTYERVWLPFFPKVAAFAAGTFSGASFLGGLGGEARRALWCLNVFSANASESCEQARRPFAAPPSPELKVPPPDPAFASAAPPHLAAPRGPHHHLTPARRAGATPRAQIRYISELPGQQADGVLLELGNELYEPGQGLPRFRSAEEYAEAMRPIVACARRLMPRAKVAAVGWTDSPDGWNRALRP